MKIQFLNHRIIVAKIRSMKRVKAPHVKVYQCMEQPFSSSSNYRPEKRDAFLFQNDILEEKQVLSDDEQVLSDDENNDLMQRLCSYASFQEAIVDREPQIEIQPKFSRSIMLDVHHIIKNAPIHDKQIKPLTLISTLVLPYPDVTISSRNMTKLLNTVIIGLLRSLRSEGITFSHVVEAQNILTKLNSISIDYSEYSYNEVDMIQWKEASTRILNLVLNHSLKVVNSTRNIHRCKEVMQHAEKAIMDCLLSSAPIEIEKLHLAPDIVSFNTLLFAWSKASFSDLKSAEYKAGSNPNTVQFAKEAADRAEAIFQVLLDISNQGNSLLRPTHVTYSALINTWSRVIDPIGPEHIINKIFPKIELLFSSGLGPRPNKNVFIAASSSLRNNTSLDVMNGQVTSLMNYAKKFKTSKDITICNAVLTSYFNMRLTSAKDLSAKTNDMITFFDRYVRSPDRVSFMLILAAIRTSVLATPHSSLALAEVAQRILQRAKNVVDTRMQNDVLEVLRHNPEETQILFDNMGDAVDKDSFLYLIQAYSLSTDYQDPKTFVYAEKAEEVLQKMMRLSESNQYLRPDNGIYHLVFQAYLARNDIKGVENAARVLKVFLDRYDRLITEYLSVVDNPQSLQDKLLRVDERPNNSSFVPILAGFSKYGDISHIKQIESLFQAMLQLHLDLLQAPTKLQKKYAPITVNTAVFNVILTTYAKYVEQDPSLLQKLESLFQRMKTHGPQAIPDKVTYTIMLKAYAGPGGSVAAIKTLLDSVDKDNISSDIKLFNVALNSLAMFGNEGALAAEDLLNKLLLGGKFKPDAHTYASVIKAWAKTGTVEGLKRGEIILRTAVDQNAADEVSFKVLISGLMREKSRDSWERVEELRRLMEKQRYSLPSSSSKSDPNKRDIILLPAPKAHEVLKRMVRTYQDTGRHSDLPRQGDFTRVLNAWFHSYDAEAADMLEELFRMKLSLNKVSDEYSVTTFDLSSVVKKLVTKKFDRAESLINELYSLGHGDIITTRIYNILCEELMMSMGSTEVAERISAILENIIDRHKEGSRTKPDAMTFGYCIVSWINSDHPNRVKFAQDLLDRMMSELSNSSKDMPRALNIILKGCNRNIGQNSRERSETFGFVVRLFQELVATPEGLSSTSFAYMVKIVGQLPNNEKMKLPLLEKVMRQCQQAGMVNEAVLSTFCRVVPHDMAQKVFNRPSQMTKINLSDLPEHWKMNAFSPENNRQG